MLPQSLYCPSRYSAGLSPVTSFWSNMDQNPHASHVRVENTEALAEFEAGKEDRPSKRPRKAKEETH